MITSLEDLDTAIVARLPCLIKSYHQADSGRRIVEVEASNEALDYDGDVVLQAALLNSAESFIATGHLDLDHLSELGARMGISDPSSYIVGRPLSVRKGENNSTFVEGEISRNLDGRDDPVRNRYDEFWASLRRDPPVVWFSSIYGWPTDMEDCTKSECSRSEVKRYLIKAIDWRSLAFTRAPKNTSLSSPTRIVTAKSYLAELVKSHTGMQVSPVSWLPDTVADAAQPCPNCGVHEQPSVIGYREHFKACKGCSDGHADILAHSMMYNHLMNRPVNIPQSQFTRAPVSGL